jgi:hypothetical protein
VAGDRGVGVVEAVAADGGARTDGGRETDDSRGLDGERDGTKEDEK